jgi:hypothetical protein
MANVREDLHIEPFILARHNLDRPVTLLRHEEAICVWHRKENGRL